MPISIAVVDDHPIIQSAVKEAVEAAGGIECLATAGEPRQIRYLYGNVDVVVLDLSVPGSTLTVPEVCGELHDAGSKIIAYTAGENRYLLRQAVQSGVDGVVLKTEPMQVLVEAIRQVAGGNLAVNAEWADAIDSDPRITEAHLTPSQLRVLELFAAGESAKHVARELDLSVSTVNEYLQRIKAKYALVGRPVGDRIELYRRAVEDGVLPPP